MSSFIFVIVLLISKVIFLSLADTLTNFGRLQNLRSRLRMIHVSQGVASSGQMVLPSISHAKDSAYKLVDVIEELQKHLTRLQDVVEISPSVAEELNSVSIGLSKQIERLQGIYDNAHHTHHPVLLQGTLIIFIFLRA